jgi:hypothetical protein
VGKARVQKVMKAHGIADIVDIVARGKRKFFVTTDSKPTFVSSKYTLLTAVPWERAVEPCLYLTSILTGLACAKNAV